MTSTDGRSQLRTHGREMIIPTHALILCFRIKLAAFFINDQAEGEISRLKYLKPTSYEPASFKLLRLRLLMPSGT